MLAESRSFIHDLKAVRQRTIKQMMQNDGVIEYPENREEIINVLNEMLSMEMACVARYRHHYYQTVGMIGKSIADKFKQYTYEEQSHADLIASRIIQLQGQPNLSAAEYSISETENYEKHSRLYFMIKEDFVAECISISMYREVISYIGHSDPTTRRMLEDILAEEEEQAYVLSNLLHEAKNEPAMQEERLKVAEA